MKWVWAETSAANSPNSAGTVGLTVTAAATVSARWKNRRAVPRADALTGWFEQCWGARAPATFNRNLDALRSAARHWRNQGWLHTDPTAALRRRARPTGPAPCPAPTSTIS